MRKLFSKLFSTSLVPLAVSAAAGCLAAPVFAGPVPVIQSPSSTINPTTTSSIAPPPSDPVSAGAIATISAILNPENSSLVAEMSGIGFGTQGQQVLNAWLNYQNAPSLDNLDAVAAAFNNLVNEAAFNGISIQDLRASSSAFAQLESALRTLIPNAVVAAGG
ncbi:MAG: hypothetical protein ACK456_02385 [Pseudanabaenaceae cyanobacterium]|jgi:hypothetical protein